MESFTSVELFSGAGGLALGLRQAGFRHLALYEWNAAAVETLQYNKQLEFPDFPVSANANWDATLARLQRHKEEVDPADRGLRYRVHLHQANAADYGVPQQRHRVFFVGFRSDLSSDWFFPTPTHSRIDLGISQPNGGPFWKVGRKPCANSETPCPCGLHRWSRLPSPRHSAKMP